MRCVIFETSKRKSMIWETREILDDKGVKVNALAPVIVSASRSTDIPAFYCDWFFNRLERGYTVWNNPFNRKRSYISFSKTRLIVFWSKNPKPLLDYLDRLESLDIHCYLQFTLNDYEREGLEPGVPPLDERLDTFKRLVDKLGFGKVIWRFDPLILTDRTNVSDLLGKVEKIGNQLKGFTEKLVFSYVDIYTYKKVQASMKGTGIFCREFTPSEMLEFATGLASLNQQWGFNLATCAEEIDLEPYGIIHNKCIDDELIFRLFPEDAALMDFLGVEKTTDMLFPSAVLRDKKDLKDKGQRKHCGCIVSKDIGAYDSCPYFCEYCYANAGKQKVLANYKQHCGDRFSESIIG